ncbi:TetR/AcrR family transcriptional regulator [Arthrobacter sp. H35-MC1]|nr:TetR/AcrR family transcriptional regulator [Arthrobacter sp. H35-MC1]MDJ0316714.1 TetR/AcrR family transcriptional regulator [Arthrobacter sp. H35-MC1]
MGCHHLQPHRTPKEHRSLCSRAFSYRYAKSTTVSGTARARARTALTQEILDVARRQLATVGASELSLRAVAQELEMVPSGLYQYFENRDALLTALIIGAYDALGEQAEQAVKNTPRGDHSGRWRAVCQSVRDWAVAHPREFTLIYGSSVTDYRATADTVAPATLIRALTAWSQVLGIISQEVFGHLEGAFSNYAELFDQSVELMEDMLGLPPHP